jgi:hypothetical protein
LHIRELQKAIEEAIFVGQSHRIGVFKELYNRQDTAEGLAARMGFDKRCGWILLEALVEMGYLKKKNDMYSVPDDVFDRLVDEKGDAYEGDFWQFLLYLINPWKSLEYVLQNGKPDETSYKDFSMRDFIMGMDSPWKKSIAPEIADICLKYCSHAKSFIDVGGAPGTIAREFAGRGIRSVVYDLPEAVDVTRDELSKVKNIEIVPGDATKSIPGGNYDIAFLGNLCHGQSPEDNAGIIRMCYERLNKKGIIVIFENLRGESYLGATLALHMITQSPHGNIYSRDEYAGWLKSSGFKDIRVEKISDPAWQLVVGKR